MSVIGILFLCFICELLYCTYMSWINFIIIIIIFLPKIIYIKSYKWRFPFLKYYFRKKKLENVVTWEFPSRVIKYTINSNVLCLLEKKNLIYLTSNGGGQMIVWPADFPVWGRPWLLASPPLSTPLRVNHSD